LRFCTFSTTNKTVNTTVHNKKNTVLAATCFNLQRSPIGKKILISHDEQLINVQSEFVMYVLYTTLTLF